MLTAAVCGDIFASPSVEAVLSAIINVTGEKGCLLIVKNYTGDRLNFGLAAEKAKKLGFKVDLVMVKDDIALPDNPQPRGIAGTALVHKVAGYAAEQGKSLEEVTAAANEAIDATASIGLAFSTCHILAKHPTIALKRAKASWAWGFTANRARPHLKTQNSVEIVNTLVEKLAAKNPDGKKVALLVNNLGGFSALEMAVLTRDTLRSQLKENVKLLVGRARW